MDAGVVSGLLQLAAQGGVFTVKTFLIKGAASKRPATRIRSGGPCGPPAPGGRAAARGRLRRRRSSPMRPGIAFVAFPCIRPRGARNATHTLFSTLLERDTSALAQGKDPKIFGGVL